MSTPHRFPVRVYYEDTDFSGLVYHASYLRFMERARTELLRELGVTQSALSAGGGLFFVVRAMAIDFRRPATMDDALIVETLVRSVGAATIELEQSVCRAAETLVKAKITIVSVEKGRAFRMPDEIRAKFQGVSSPKASETTPRSPFLNPVRA